MGLLLALFYNDYISFLGWIERLYVPDGSERGLRVEMGNTVRPLVGGGFRDGSRS